MTDLDRHQLRPLLERVLAGERQAYNELFAQLRPYLHALVRRYLGQGAQGPLDHSNVVQSSLRRVFEHLDDVLQDDPSVPHLLAWVKKIVYHRAVDELRRAGVAGAEALPVEELAERRSAAETAARDRRAARVAAALARLPERQRQVVEWHWFDRLRDAEISALLGGSVAAIRVLRCRALKALRRYVEALDEDE
jgi:RNA polymerase sigma-70 factor (ECF subfamily)